MRVGLLMACDAPMDTLWCPRLGCEGTGKCDWAIADGSFADHKPFSDNHQHRHFQRLRGAGSDFKAALSKCYRHGQRKLSQRDRHAKSLAN
jgi:hypothetical protein